MHIVWDIYVVKLDIPLSFLRWIPDVYHHRDELELCLPTSKEARKGEAD